MRQATYASVGVALILIGAKLFAYLMTDSVSLLSTLLDSLLDAAASLVNLVAVRTALTPADDEHRFGHGKAEPLAALGQSAFIARLGRLPAGRGRKPPGQSLADPEQRDRPRGHGAFRSRPPSCWFSISAM